VLEQAWDWAGPDMACRSLPLPAASVLPRAQLFAPAYVAACDAEDAAAMLGCTCPNTPVSLVARD